MRLEWNKVLVSFAIPKGPSFNPKDKRLAVKVENHPINYANFEGTIPKGQYGGGTVILIDKGYWIPNSKPNFKSGPIKFFIDGKRIKGFYSLFKFKENNWLLIKEKDNYVSNKSLSVYKTSIKTNKTKKEIETKENKFDVNITHPEKIIIPKGNITKEDIFLYYKLISKKMMPFLSNRLISTVRCPNGIDSATFYMKHFNSKSNNLKVKRLTEKDGDKNNYYYLKNEEGLLEEVNMNSYEFHIWGSKQNSINKPDLLVFDFDPDEKLSLVKLHKCVKDLKIILDKLKLKSYLKTSGNKGYHVFVPLKTTSWDKTEKIAKDISKLMVNNHEEEYTINMRKEKRNKKIFIDYLRNKKGATSVCPYSIRLKDNAPISMPITWGELDKVKPNEITIKNVKERLKKKNPWHDFFTS